MADYKREIAELKHQLEAKNKDSAENSSELTRLRQQIEQMRTQHHQEKSTATNELSSKIRALEDELRLTKSRSQMSTDELSRLRTQLIEKDKRANELSSQAGQFNVMKTRCENYQKEIEILRKKTREDQVKHKEEI